MEAAEPTSPAQDSVGEGGAAPESGPVLPVFKSKNKAKPELDKFPEEHALAAIAFTNTGHLGLLDNAAKDPRFESIAFAHVATVGSVPDTDLR